MNPHCSYNKDKYESMARRIIEEQAAKTKAKKERMKDRLLIAGIIIIFLAMAWVALFMPVKASAQVIPGTVLQIARSEIGHGESFANNYGSDIRRYGAEGKPWCAAFVSYCLKGYGLPHILRAKDFVKYGRCVAICEVRPGDIVIFTRKGGGHAGIVEKLTSGGFISIEGNTGAFPAKVKRVKHSFGEKAIYRFVRLRRAR